MAKKDGSPQLDLFVGDVLLWSPKADRHTMEHPFFSLSKKRDTKIREYTSPDGSVHITITPSVRGMATIWDKDILIYAASVLRDALNRGEKITENRPINIMSYNLLAATSRGTGGNSYDQIEECLERLVGTRIKTDITTNDQRERESFGMIETWKIVEKGKKLVRFEVKLSDWFFNAIISGRNELLTLNREYFQLSGGLERRLYELARKHCGHQGKWSIFLEKLHIKSGSASPLRKFRMNVKEIAKENRLPDYIMDFEEATDKVTFYSKNAREVAQAITESLSRS